MVSSEGPICFGSQNHVPIVPGPEPFQLRFFVSADPLLSDTGSSPPCLTGRRTFSPILSEWDPYRGFLNLKSASGTSSLRFSSCSAASSNACRQYVFFHLCPVKYAEDLPDGSASLPFSASLIRRLCDDICSVETMYRIAEGSKVVN